MFSGGEEVEKIGVLWQMTLRAGGSRLVCWKRRPSFNTSRAASASRPPIASTPSSSMAFRPLLRQVSPFALFHH